jgi:hypothetical protein
VPLSVTSEGDVDRRAVHLPHPTLPTIMTNTRAAHALTSPGLSREALGHAEYDKAIMIEEAGLIMMRHSIYGI